MKMNLERLRKGTLKLLILEALNDKPMHAYEIIKSIEKKFHGIYKPSPGSLYPVLKQLIESGMITVEEKDDKKIYIITDKGKEAFNKMKTEMKNVFTKNNQYRKLVNQLFEIGLIIYNFRDKLSEEDYEKINNIINGCKNEIEDLLNKLK
ncbi:MULTISPECIES: PadR family transcriptional regulator [Acidianus]|jgi:DNA-binding PadR family transcriptional regulator|uniref:PadR family transcriptional regulator n=1 Tax=Acidianus ambivalens TaxID=2283 RepID=A0A650CVA7_ACIAM|nr:PadR family transcriptional regulator [Acidianus ambivalens]MQL55629.1 PadR family transcriptional regulator [Acidianus ambivalens]QGR21790.1 PadR family transcriptional regulator [Acidianus ambivalens]